jgi:hypothetical protein
MARYIVGKLYLSTQDVAAIIGISSRTVLRWAKNKSVILRGKDSKKFTLDVYTDPFSGYTYIGADNVDKLKKILQKSSKPSNKH